MSESPDFPPPMLVEGTSVLTRDGVAWKAAGPLGKVLARSSREHHFVVPEITDVVLDVASYDKTIEVVRVARSIVVRLQRANDELMTLIGTLMVTNSGLAGALTGLAAEGDILAEKLGAFDDG